MNEETVNTRICKKCGRELPLTNEYFHKKRQGFHWKCKKCRTEEQKEYYKKYYKDVLFNDAPRKPKTRLKKEQEKLNNKQEV